MSHEYAWGKTMPTVKREHPILFSGPMVRANLEGRKTQTRRVVRLPESIDPENYGGASWERARDPQYIKPGQFTFIDQAHPCESWPYIVECPYGQPGHRLWVRETFCLDWIDKPIYRADGGSAVAAGYVQEPRWRPSIFMPRWASRIILEIVQVRVERLQEISTADIEAEGIPHGFNPSMGARYANGLRCAFQDTWDALNAKRGFGWNMNPWVWVIEFLRLEAEVRTTTA